MSIQGVHLFPHKITHDLRGSLAEVFRSDFRSAPLQIRQWNCVRSHANVLRGMHAHLLYDEVYIVLSGRLFLTLKDARPSSPTFGHEQSFSAADVSAAAVVVPSGVAHGVYFETAGMLMYGLSVQWTGEYEYEFRWNDRALQSRWPTQYPILSDRDAKAGSFADMVAAMASARELVAG